ncbi:MAG: response regulator [Solirubrobacterales bacterium]|nr:response regulator [Solirubrobacterales bacterium]
MSSRRPERPGLAAVPSSTSTERPDRGLILVAEDNEINQLATTRMLARLGFQVDIAHNGAEAVELSSRMQYCAIFMDCQMPELDGYEATVLIRQREGDTRHTPIVALTANTIAGERESCLAAGMDDYLAKPLRFEQLARLCESILSEATAPPPSTKAPPPAPSGTGFDPHFVEDAVGLEHAATVLTIFLEHADDCVSELSDAIAADDRERAARVAHKLKGSAAVVGANDIAQVCEEICTLSSNIDADLEQPHTRLRTGIAGTAAAVRAHLDALASAA